MNKRRFQRAFLLTGFISLLLLGGYGFWLFHQYALNRQLIAEINNQDYNQAGDLVRAGADPNTLFYPPPPSSPRELWNHLFYRSALAESHSRSAFACACSTPDWGGVGDAPHLVQIMLQHGANPNMRDELGQTPLQWAVEIGRQETVGVLLDHGAKANAKDSRGESLLITGMQGNNSAAIVRLLLEHGADPNASTGPGTTILEYAQEANRPDIVVLLKQAGAKK